MVYIPKSPKRARNMAFAEASMLAAGVAYRKRASAERARRAGRDSVASHRTSDAETAEKISLALSKMANGDV